MQLDTDSIARTDKLERKKFAKEIAMGLVHGFPNGSESLVFGLNGSWGSGKSTLLKFIIEEIAEQNKSESGPNFVIYEFNPWMFSGQNHLQEEFFIGLAKCIPNYKGRIKRTTQKLSRALKKLAFIKYLSPTIGEGLKDLSYALDKLMKEDSFTELKSKISTELVKHDIRLLITIDDLDRLTPEEALEIFRLVKLNSNFSNTVFLLAYEKEVIVSYLKDSFGQNAEKYLDKIVQVDYQLPAIADTKIKGLFFEQLVSLGNELNIDLPIQELNELWDFHGLGYFFKTIRDINRFMNALRVRLPSVHLELNLRDFLAIEAIRVFDYHSYQKIYIEQKKIFRYEKEPSGVKMFDSKKPEHSARLYSKLFRYEWDEFVGDVLDPDKHIRDPLFFDRYFSLNIVENDITEREVGLFVNGRANRESILRRNIDSGKIRPFLLCVRSALMETERSAIHDQRIIDDLIHYPRGQQKYHYIFGGEAIVVLDIIKSVVSSQRRSQESFKKFLDTLLSGSRDYSVLQFHFLDYILACIEDDFKLDFADYKNLIRKSEAEIREFLHERLANWAWTLFYYDREWLDIRIARRFLLRLKQLNLDGYVNFQSKYLVEIEGILFFLKILTKNDPDTGEPKVDEKLKSELIFEQLEETYRSSISNLDHGHLTQIDKQLIVLHSLN